MNNIATTRKVITLATLLTLCAHSGRSGEEYMAMAPDAAYYAALNEKDTSARFTSSDSDSDKPLPELKTNTIKLTLPTPDASSFNHLRTIEVNPTASNGQINFGLQDGSNSYVPSLPGLGQRSGAPKIKVATPEIKAVPLAEKPAETISPAFRKTTSATILLPSSKTVTPTSSTPVTGMLTSAPGTDDTDPMPGLITPEQLATGKASSAPTFMPGKADLSDLVSFQNSDAGSLPSSSYSGVADGYPSFLPAPSPYNDIMTMAASPHYDVSTSTSSYASSYEPYTASSESTTSFMESLTVPGSFSQGTTSFHSQPPKLTPMESSPVSIASAFGSGDTAPSFMPTAPAESSGFAMSSSSSLPPPAQTGNSENGGASSGPLRLSIAPLMNTPLDVPLAGTVAAGQAPAAPSLQPPASMLGEPSSAYQSSESLRSGRSPSLALTPGDFSSTEYREPVQTSRQTIRRDPPQKAVDSFPNQSSRRNPPRDKRATRKQNAPAREREAEGFTNMRGVRNVIGPPDPKMFR